MSIAIGYACPFLSYMRACRFRRIDRSGRHNHRARKNEGISSQIVNYNYSIVRKHIENPKTH
jgi:hypothetical protein